MNRKQSTNRFIMIRPSNFGFNVQTSSSNVFQINDETSIDEIQRSAQNQFDEMIEKLRSNKIHVDVFDDDQKKKCPDAVFLNNWFSTHEDGTIVLYPMMAENRRLERRRDIVDFLLENYEVRTIVDLTVNERHGSFLEGTGSLVLDRLNRIVYAARSIRTDQNLVERWTKLLDYRPMTMLFDVFDRENQAIYHTNVVLAIGTRLAIICLETIKDTDQRHRIIDVLQLDSKRRILEITFDQVEQFAGNMLELMNSEGEHFLLMSKSAELSLRAEQKETIAECSLKIISCDVSTIEKFGGGSVRCMISENFLELLPAGPPLSKRYNAEMQVLVSSTD